MEKTRLYPNFSTTIIVIIVLILYFNSGLASECDSGVYVLEDYSATFVHVAAESSGVFVRI